MRLSEFIEANLEHILNEWEHFARTRLPAAGSMDPTALCNAAAEILCGAAKDMESSQSENDRAEKSKGERPDNAPDLTSNSEEYASQRFANEFTLDQLVSEYRALRASVIRLWNASAAASSLPSAGERQLP